MAGKKNWKILAEKRFLKRFKDLQSISDTKSMTINIDVGYQLLWEEGIQATLETYEYDAIADMRDQVWENLANEKARFQKRIVRYNDGIESFAKSKGIHPEDVYRHISELSGL